MLNKQIEHIYIYIYIRLEKFYIFGILVVLLVILINFSDLIFNYIGNSN